MMKKKHILFILISILMSTIFLTGCLGSDDDDGSGLIQTIRDGLDKVGVDENIAELRELEDDPFGLGELLEEESNANNDFLEDHQSIFSFINLYSGGYENVEEVNVNVMYQEGEENGILTIMVTMIE